MKLSAALDFKEHSGLDGTAREYMHLFFVMGDGNLEENFFDQEMDVFNSHIAKEVSTQDNLPAMQERINESGITCVGSLDHGFADPVHFYDPNGI